MKYLAFLFFLLCTALNLNAQLKHELKLSLYSPISSKIVPHYELVTENEKIGIELGLGINFNKVTTFDSFTQGRIEKFDRRAFNSFIGLRYYKLYNINERYFSIFVGPFASFDQVLFVEDRYFDWRNQASVVHRVDNSFVGQKEVNAGAYCGFKFIFKNGLAFEGSLGFGSNFFEIEPDTFSNSHFGFVNADVKVAYRFGLHPYAESED